MRITNAILVLAATVLYVLLTLLAGRASIAGGLGPDGSVYEAMVANHDLQAGSAVDKLTPEGRLPTEAETSKWNVVG